MTELATDATAQAMMQYATPGESHELLSRLVGNFAIKARMWPGPGAAPMEGVGSAQARFILDGRFVEEDFTSHMGPQAVHGRLLTGFDNAKRKYIAFWADTMSTGVVATEGTAEPGGEGFSTSGTMYQALLGQYVPVRFVTRFEAGRHVAEMYVGAPGSEHKALETVYTRKS